MMCSKIKSTISTLISSIVSFALIININANYSLEPYQQELTVSNELLWKDGYAEDKVLVVLTNEASLKFKNYNTQDFPSIECQSVENLTVISDEQVRLSLENDALQQSEDNSTTINKKIDLKKYYQILCINLSSPGKSNVIKAIKELQSLDYVLYAGPDIPYYLDRECDDPKLSFGMIDFSRNHNPISLAEAWDITTGSKSIKVGIIDTGVWGDHEDLKDNINTQLSVDYSHENASGTAFTDNNGHGTSVAGIIGSKGNNGIGTCGVCWEVSLVSLRATILYTDNEGNSDELIYGSGIIDALSHAESNNIKIINMSASSYDYDPAVAIAIQSYTGLLVCTAGNEINNNDVTPKYPANIDLPNIIVVGASNSLDDELFIVSEEGSKGSNYGKRSVDLFAPTRIYTTDISAELYSRFSGTSAAAPVVAGVAALMLSVNPNLTTSQLKDIIIRSVDVVPALEDYCVSGGRINAYKAVRTAQMYRFAMDSTYTQLDTTDTLCSKAHGVWFDNCECSCRNADLSCDSGLCDFVCDPCDNCHFYFTELHNWRYVPESTTNIYTHRQYCYDCGYNTTGYHNWVLDGTTYVCTDCGMESDYIPAEGIQNLSDEELPAYLATLSDTELEALIASLHEDQVARVTALMPSDDENLTE